MAMSESCTSASTQSLDSEPPCGDDHLRQHFQRHSDQEGRLDFNAFMALAAELNLPLTQTSQAEQHATFTQISEQLVADDAVEFNEFLAWVASSDDPNALVLREHCRIDESDASVLAGLTRSVTHLLRPLAVALGPGLLVLKMKCKHAAMMLSKKAVVIIKAKVKNPTQLFRRNALNPLADFSDGSESRARQLRSAVQQRGTGDVLRQLSGPYAANALVAMAMFQSYSVVCDHLRRWRIHDLSDSGHPVHPMWATPLRCEAVSGFAAGLVQASLSAPLYNLRLRLRSLRACPDERLSIRVGLSRIYQARGLLGLYANWPFIYMQECCSLAAYFASYELFREKLVQELRREAYPNGEMDHLAWALSAGGAGIVLTGVGLPFENALRWHVSLAGDAPRGVVRHLARKVPDKRACSQILFRGMIRRLPVAPLAGLPLLVYQVMMHHGWVPNVHDESWTHNMLPATQSQTVQTT